MAAVTIRPVSRTDRPAWEILYRGYADYYRVEADDIRIQSLWDWLMDERHEVEGLVAQGGDALVGLAHFRRMPSPLRGADIGFLDDLFVAPAARGSGAGRRLVGKVAEIAGERGWPVVRWLTRDDNHRAKSLYDKLATRTDWNVYELKT